MGDPKQRAKHAVFLSSDNEAKMGPFSEAICPLLSSVVSPSSLRTPADSFPPLMSKVHGL